MSIDLKAMPKLGFGLMRLPEVDGRIDHDHVCRMVDLYMKSGLNYFDTAYVYHGGKSEVEIREALVKRYPRDSFTIADKLPGWEIRTASDVERIFDEQLERCGVDYFDFYLLHSIEDGNNYDVHVKYDTFNWCMKRKEEGKIRHLGFSFHGSPELLEEVLDAHPETEFVDQSRCSFAEALRDTPQEEYPHNSDGTDTGRYARGYGSRDRKALQGQTAGKERCLVGPQVCGKSSGCHDDPVGHVNRRAGEGQPEDLCGS